MDGTPFEIDLNMLGPNPGDDFFDYDAILTVTLISLPGDYNNDGVVDAADFTVWRDNLGAPARALVNDVDGGVISNAQYATRLANFGATVPSSSPAAIPEPSGIMSLAIGVAGLMLRRRTARQTR